MIIYTENNQEIGSDLLSAILRHDLVPIPVSLEITCRATDELVQLLAVGKVLTLANGIHLTIIKSQHFANHIIKDGKRTGSIAVIAVLQGCEILVNVANKAVIHENVSFGEIYRSLGAKLKIHGDIKVNGFTCLNGQLPTARIALSLQKEGAVVCYDLKSQSIHIKRLQDLFQGNAVLYDPSNVQWLNSTQSDTLYNTNYLSLDNASSVVGQVNTGKNIDYIPRTDNRELQNLRRILITKGVIIRAIDERLSAGSLLSIDEQKYVVLTHAIRFDTGSMGGGAVMASKAWIAQIVET